MICSSISGKSCSTCSLVRLSRKGLIIVLSSSKAIGLCFFCISGRKYLLNWAKVPNILGLINCICAHRSLREFSIGVPLREKRWVPCSLSIALNTCEFLFLIRWLSSKMMKEKGCFSKSAISRVRIG